MLNHLYYLNKISIQLVINILITILIFFFMWLPVLNSSFGLIDDHEIIWFMYEFNTNRDILKILNNTELGLSSDISRFRPVYYLLRVLESVLWGNNPFYWYLTRFIIALLFSLTFAYSVSKLFPNYLSTILIVIVLSSKYWSDIFTRLGPSENYSVFGFTIFIIWLIRFLSIKKLTLLSTLLLTFSLLIMAGSKENLLIVIIIPIFILFIKDIYKTFYVKLTLSFCITLISFFILILFSRLIEKDADIYSNSISISERFSIIFSFFSMPIIWFWFIALFILFYITRNEQFSISKIDFYKSLFIIKLNLFLIFAFFTQYFFYTKSWPYSTEGRYLFPGILFFQVGFLLIFQSIFYQFNFNFFKKKKYSILIIFIFIFSYLSPTFRLPISNRNVSFDIAYKTNKFQINLVQIIDQLKSDSTRTLIINSHNASDSEPITSVFRYLRFYGVENKIAVHGVFEPMSSSQQDVNLINSIKKLEIFGDAFFIPFDEINKKKCYSIGMSGAPFNDCEVGPVIWPYAKKISIR